MEAEGQTKTANSQSGCVSDDSQPEIKTMKLSWIKGWLSGKPHFIIGGKDNPYLLRWYILPRNRFFNIYLHKFLRDDDDRALHDHPWWFISLMLKGTYQEIVETSATVRRAPSVAFRVAEHKHRVVLKKDANGKGVPCWTILITGSVRRVWGFWCPQGFRTWKEFASPVDAGQIGRGCE